MVHTTPERFENGAEKPQLAVAFTPRGAKFFENVTFA
jgi:hypothetical protein